MSILITGGTGYIGSHTVVELLKLNQDIIIVDNLSNSSTLVLERIEKITGKTVHLLMLMFVMKPHLMLFFRVTTLKKSFTLLV